MHCSSAVGLSQDKVNDVVSKVLEAEVLLRELALAVQPRLNRLARSI